MPINDYLLHRIDGANKYLLTNDTYNIDTYLSNFTVSISISTFDNKNVLKYMYIPISKDRLISADVNNFLGFRIFYGMSHNNAQENIFHIALAKLNNGKIDNESLGQLFLIDSQKFYKFGQFQFSLSVDVTQSELDRVSNLPEGAYEVNLNNSGTGYPYSYFNKYLDFNDNFNTNHITLAYYQNAPQSFDTTLCIDGQPHNFIIDQKINTIPTCALCKGTADEIQFKCTKCGKEIAKAYCTTFQQYY